MITELDQAVLHIQLNRPDKLNALNHETLNQLSQILHQAKQDQTIRGILLSGAGKAFCAGADISELAKTHAQNGQQFAEYGQAIFNQLENLGKPSIAAVHGVAFGGGCELAMAASLRFATKEARFAQPEIKLGVIPGYGGTQRLPQLIGKGRALDMLLSGEPIDANTAFNWGLVNQLCEADNLLAAAKAKLVQLAGLAPIAQAKILSVLGQGYTSEAVAFGVCCGTEAKNIGVERYLRQRK